MKRALFIFFIFISVCGYSQNFKVIGPDTTTGRPGYLFTLKPQYVQSPITAVNDSTIGFITGSTGDILYYNGGWLKRGIGTSAQTLHVVGGLPQWVDTAVGGGGGGQADSAYFWSRTGNVALSTNWLGTKTATSLRVRTNNTERMVVDSLGNVGIGTATPATSFHSFGVTSVGDSVTSTNAIRQFNVIGNNAVLRMHRVSASAATAAPSYELVHSTTKNGTLDAYWDWFADTIGLAIRDRNYTPPADTNTNFAIMRATGNVQIGNNRVDIPSALFSITSTTKGFLPPRLTTTQRNAISSPATGLTIYNTTTSNIESYNGSAWVGASGLSIGTSIGSATAGSVFFAGTSGVLEQDNANLFFDNTNNRLGIGNAAPSQRLDVGGGGASNTTEQIRINAGATGIPLTIYAQNGTTKGLFGLAGVNNDLITGSSAGDFNIRNSQRMLFSTDAGSTAAANINSSGRWFFGGTTSATSTVQVGGSIALAYVAKATSYTATISDNVIEVTATGQTITLPTAVSISGRIYTIKLTASGTGTVATTSSQTIDGSTTYSLSAQYKYVTVQSNNANWIIIANN